jgi:hypothetical protein
MLMLISNASCMGCLFGTTNSLRLRVDSLLLLHEERQKFIQRNLIVATRVDHLHEIRTGLLDFSLAAVCRIVVCRAVRVLGVS